MQQPRTSSTFPRRVTAWWHALTQWLYPAPFRIAPVPGDAATGLLRRLWDGVARLSRLQQADGIGNSDAKRLGDVLFRVRREVKKMLKKSAEDKAAIRIGDVATELEYALKKMELQVLDPTGEPWTNGRRDFEQLGPAEVDPAVTEPTITFVDRPVIVLRKKLIQTAKGLIGLPPNDGQPKQG